MDLLISNKIASMCKMGWLIYEIQEVVYSSGNTFKVIFAPWFCNGAMHHLAKLALCIPIVKVWIEVAQSEIYAYLYKYIYVIYVTVLVNEVLVLKKIGKIYSPPKFNNLMYLKSNNAY